MTTNRNIFTFLEKQSLSLYEPFSNKATFLHVMSCVLLCNILKLSIRLKDEILDTLRILRLRKQIFYFTIFLSV